VAQKPVLGKGLASLLPGANTVGPTPTILASSVGPSSAFVANVIPPSSSSASDASNRDRHMGISMAFLDEIEANHFQPRRDFDDNALKELAQSIRTSGIIQPLVVRKNAKDQYELIAGERRLRAAKLAGLKQVPIVIRRSTDRETLELALIENIQRQNLNCIDEALAYFQLIQDFSLTQEEVSDRVGKERATVANYLRLLRLPEAIIDDLKRQILTFGHGKALLGLDDADLRLRARAQVIEKRLSVRETEALVDSMKNAAKADGSSPSKPTSTSSVTQRLANLSKELAHQWSTKVEVKGSEHRGKIVIHYSSRQDLDRILEEMNNEKI
jgi:ParB family transcriptional regulator, chromosome partitioning protein